MRRVCAADALFLALVFSALTVVQVVTAPLVWTGDEPGYSFQGLGLFSNFTFRPSDARWHEFLARSHLTAPPRAGQQLGEPFHSLAPSLVGGPALATLGLEPARWLNFLLGLIGIGWLFSILKSAFARNDDAKRAAGLPVYLAIAATAFSLPLLAYFKLLYPEVPLFVSICGAFASLRARASYRTIAWSVFLPFVYVRALPLSAGFVALALLEQYRRGARFGALFSLATLFLAGLALFAVYQVTIFGSLNGGVFATYTPSLRLLPERLGMQLFDVRHGLVAYSPIFFIGFAGLILGALRRVPACVDAAVLLACYVLTFIWSTASESWTARFWVAGLPFLAVGLCYWLRSVRGLATSAPAGIFAAVTLTNSILYTISPTWFLGNRRGSLTYAILFKSIPVHLGLFLPVDAADASSRVYAQTIPYLLAFAALLVGMLVLSALARSGGLQRLAALSALAVCLLPFALCLARTVPRGSYSVSSEPGENGIGIRLTGRTAPVFAVQLDDTYLRNWGDAPQAFRVRCFDGSGTVKESVGPSRPLLGFLECTREIDIAGFGAAGDGRFFDHVGNVTLVQRLL